MSSVDVIVPCYKYGNYLKECVQSVLQQSQVDVRVLIIDDASPDNTYDIASSLAASDQRVSVVRHLQNRGHIETFNEGLDWASGDYVLLLSADDYLLPHCLASSVSVMNEHSDVAFTYGRAVVLTPTDSRHPISHSQGEYFIEDGRDFIKRSGGQNLVPTPTAVVRTAIQKRVGGYRKELPHSGDMEMWLRLAVQGAVGRIDAFQAVYRLHSANMSLAYYCDGGFGDLVQKKAAIDSFFATYATSPSILELHPVLMRSLATIAISAASMAFNDERRDISDKLAHLAREFSPGIERSIPWFKLTCKRQLPWLWRAIQRVTI